MPPTVFRISPSAAILFKELSLESVVYKSDSIALLVSSFVVFAGSGKNIGRDIYNFAIPTSVELSYKKCGGEGKGRAAPRGPGAPPSPAPSTPNIFSFDHFVWLLFFLFDIISLYFLYLCCHIS